jgi:hypothetical protein
MPEVQALVLINAPRDKVFDLLIDTRRHGEFVYGYVDQYEGPEILSAGVWFHWRIKLYGRVWRAHSQVSQFHRPSRYQEKIGIPGFTRATLTKILAEEDGKTRLTWLWEYTPAFGPLGLLIDGVAGGKKTASRGIEHSMREIKRIMEENS